MGVWGRGLPGEEGERGIKAVGCQGTGSGSPGGHILIARGEDEGGMKEWGQHVTLYSHAA